MIINYAKKIELKLRFLLICFCAFTFLYSIASAVSPIIHIEFKNGFVVLLMVVFAIVIGYFIKYEFMEFFKTGWDWKPKNKIEKLQNELFCIVGIGFLYYFTQVGLMVLFFPSFELLTFYSYSLYNILFPLISLFIYILYRCTILKF